MPRPTLINDRFLRASRCHAADATPVWFMRQAGRYLPDYRALRSRYSLLEICRTPALAAEAAAQPVQILNVDAAILFSDILLPLIPMGIDVDYVDGEGPVLRGRVESRADVEALKSVDVRTDLGFVIDAVRETLAALASRVPLIGFAGGQFTLASYLLGGGSAAREAVAARRLMYADNVTWHRLMGRLTRVVADLLVAQVEAGAHPVQLFDSWVGTLSPQEYREFVLPHTQDVLGEVGRLHVPVIYFGTGTASLLRLLREAGADVIGVDWRIPLDAAWEAVGADVAVQGNLDPAALFAPRADLERRVRAVLDQAAGRPGHIFNLGHGILPETPVENVQAVVEMVHGYRAHR